MRSSKARSIALWTLAAVALSQTLPGCGYSLRPPYDERIQTVYVPMFQSIRFRRDLNQQLTELVQKEIERRTPYKVVGRPEGADARLEGTIIADDKLLIVENPNNLPRMLAASVTANVSFTDNRSGRTTTRNTPPVLFNQMANFYPEIGQTAGLGFREALERLAEDIVNTMETPWGDQANPSPVFPDDLMSKSTTDDVIIK
jgi:hypothetical protein